MAQTSLFQSTGPRGSAGRKHRFDPRPESPAHLAIAALVLWFVGALLPALHVLGTVGVMLLLVAGVTSLMRPRSRTMYWRDRKIELDDQPRPAQRVYRLLFKR